MEKMGNENRFFSKSGVIVTILMLSFLTGCGPAEPAVPDFWLKQGGVYAIEVKVKTQFVQNFANRTYYDSTEGLSRWQVHCLKKSNDTLWCNLCLRQMQHGTIIENFNRQVAPISFRLINGKPVFSLDSLNIIVEMHRSAVLREVDAAPETNIVRRKQLVTAWLQPLVVAHLYAILFEVRPDGLPMAGRTWEGKLPVWQPIPGAFDYTGKISSVTNKLLTIHLEGFFTNIDIMNQATLLPLGGQLIGKMLGELSYPSFGDVLLQYAQKDSLYGHLMVAGRKVPSTIMLETNISVQEESLQP
jgi:hypothetical protein